MKKFLTIALVFVMVTLFAACGTASTHAVDINAVNEQVKALVEDEGPLDLNAESFSELYAIDAADMAQAVGVTTMDGAFPDEIILIKAADDAALARIQSILQQHLDDVMTQSENYDAENYALLQKCKVLVAGDTIALFVSDHFTEMEQIFVNASKG